MTTAEIDRTEAALPRIWFSRIMSNMDFIPVLDYHTDLPLKEFLAARHARRPLEPDEAPKYVYFFSPNKKSLLKSNIDAFKAADRVIVISPKFRDVLVQFDLGKTGVFEVPVYNNAKLKPSKYPPHYILHVAELKSAFVPDDSDGVEQIAGPEFRAGTGPKVNKWVDLTDVLPAVRASAAEGADLWADERLTNTIFFSDRLKQAMDAAGVKSRELKPIEAKVLP